MTTTTAPTPAELRLLRAAAAGDPAATSALYRRHWPALLRVCERVTGCSDDAADAAQDAMLAVFARLPRLELETLNLGGYLRMAGHRAALERLRTRRRSVPLDGIAEPVDAAPACAEQVERQELARAVRTAMRELPRRQREALFQSAYEGRPLLEIGDGLGLSRNATAQLVHRARRGLAVRLAQDAQPVLRA
ncbi:MAG: sigma-70 family RNA polymerase sigma factor [Solirubrobacteraceae bacterium]|nr:sigma-70 family RNA polymerase sigma factor [Solirubrobacteraceae bacterium]